MASENFGLTPELFAQLNNSPKARHLKIHFGVDGLSDSEIDDIQSKLGFAFPPDFRFYLSNASEPAIGNCFSWWQFDKKEYESHLEWLLKGVLFDVEHNDIWLKRWGVRPDNRFDMISVVVDDFQSWPKLLPFWGGYLPANPCEAGNPVFSVKQTDVIYIGGNLADCLISRYLDYEGMQSRANKMIEVWSDFAEGREGVLRSAIPKN